MRSPLLLWLGLAALLTLAAGCPGTSGVTDGDDPAAQTAEQPLQVAPGDDEAAPDSIAPPEEGQVSELDLEGCVCPMIWEPVCGTDGQTYGNACQADCAEVPIRRQGECDPDDPHAELPGDIVDPLVPAEPAQTYEYHICNEAEPCRDGYQCVNIREGCRPSQCAGNPWDGLGICTRDCRQGYGICVPEGFPAPPTL